MTAPNARSHDVDQRGQPVRNDADDMTDEDSGLPVSIPPDGEKLNRPERVDPEDRLKIDPESRIPRPVQPDLA